MCALALIFREMILDFFLEKGITLRASNCISSVNLLPLIFFVHTHVFNVKCMHSYPIFGDISRIVAKYI